MPHNCLGVISDEQAAGGVSSLKITDHEKDRGSSITSAVLVKIRPKGSGSVSVMVLKLMFTISPGYSTSRVTVKVWLAGSSRQSHQRQ